MSGIVDRLVPTEPAHTIGDHIAILTDDNAIGSLDHFPDRTVLAIGMRRPSRMGEAAILQLAVSSA